MNCSICYDNLESEFIKLEYSHSYCNECFKTWYSQFGVKESCCLCFKIFDVEDFGINDNSNITCNLYKMNFELSKKENVNKKIMVKYFKRCIKKCSVGYTYGEKYNKVDEIIYRCLDETYIELVYYLFDKLNIKTKTLDIETVLLGLITNFTYDLDVKHRINLLRYLKNKNCFSTKKKGSELKNYALVYAVDSEKLELVKYVHEELNFNFTIEALEAAYRNGIQDIIEYLDKIMYTNYKNKLEKKYNKF